MVTMQMGDKNMTHFRETYPATTQLHLHALPTINHEKLVAQLYNLCGRIMTKGGQRTATP